MTIQEYKNNIYREIRLEQASAEKQARKEKMILISQILLASLIGAGFGIMFYLGF